MQHVSDRNFGLLIAYILPGFTALMGLSTAFPTLKVWLSAASVAEVQPTVAGFLFVTLASVLLGMALGAFRWCVVDQIHAVTGLPRPQWDDSKLQANLDAFRLVVEHHYRHYQFYANTLIAGLMAYAAHRYEHGFTQMSGALEIGLAAFSVMFWMTSRSTLKNYYARASSVLAQRRPKTANGNHHPETEKSKPAPKTGQGKGQTAKNGKTADNKKN